MYSYLKKVILVFSVLIASSVILYPVHLQAEETELEDEEPLSFEEENENGQAEEEGDPTDEIGEEAAKESERENPNFGEEESAKEEWALSEDNEELSSFEGGGSC